MNVMLFNSMGRRQHLGTAKFHIDPECRLVKKAYDVYEELRDVSEINDIQKCKACFKSPIFGEQISVNGLSKEGENS